MNLSDRMKHYERSVGSQLTLRCPAIVRIDGRAFHSFTKPFARPYDGVFRSLMVRTAQHLCGAISTARFAYGQSDEISILLTDYNRFETDQFFDGKVQKLASVIASEATNAFNRALWGICTNGTPAFEDLIEPLTRSMFEATFDARVFSIPERDTGNYFVWRQQDAIRNSILSLGQAHFSHKELQGKSVEDIKAMLEKKSQPMDPEKPFITWGAQPDDFKHGFTIDYNVLESKWCHSPALLFEERPHFFENLLTPDEE